MQLAPAAMGQQRPPALSHARHGPAGAGARRGPGLRGSAEARARPVQDLDGAALGRRIGERARQCPQGLGVDAREGRQFQHKTGAGGIDVEFARFVPGAPGQ